MVKEGGRRRGGRVLLGVCFLLLVITGIGVYKYHYPYGSSHHCSKSITASLMFYADDHGGKYPSAASSAEALALLADYTNIEFLAGKSVFV